MSRIINAILIILILFIVAYFFMKKMKKKADEKVEDKVKVDDKTYTLEMMTQFVKKRLDEITKINLYDIGLSEEELKRRKAKKYELKKALKGCTYGDVNDKKYVKELIYDLLNKEYGVNEINISKSIPFDVPSLLTVQDKFDIIIYMYKNQFGSEAFPEIIKKYDLDRLKYVAGESKPCYVITEDEINQIYDKEQFVLTFEDELNVVVQRIYQHYKGYSSIDEIRDMNIDGISGGVSGLPESFLSQVAQSDGDYLTQIADHKVPRACDSIWIMFHGKSIRLAILSFGSEAELKRVCQNIYKYNNPGQLSDTNGYKINEMKDGSRVVVVRPSMSETWAFFVRKFDVKRAALEQIVLFPGKEETIQLLKFLVKGARIISLTGEQGCGKTTMLMAMIENIYETMNLRITETAFELHLRKIYPTRNILSMRETETISGQQCLDVQKKTDGSVNIIGEVATDPVASWMIQSAQVASKFTLFTHPAKTFPDLVTALRNSMLRAGVFKNERTAEEQVVSVLNFDIHLVKDFRGRRFIERITECIPIKQSNEYRFDYDKEKTMDGKWSKFMTNATYFMQKTTNQELYTYRNILEYHDGTYVLTNRITDNNLREMIINMDDKDAEDFREFCKKNWNVDIKKYDDEEDDAGLPKEADLDAKPTEKKVDHIKPSIDLGGTNGGSSNGNKINTDTTTRRTNHTTNNTQNFEMNNPETEKKVDNLLKKLGKNLNNNTNPQGNV